MNGKRKYSGWLPVLILVLFLLIPVVTISCVHRENMRLYQAVISCLSETEQEEAETILRRLFTGEYSEEDVLKGTEVLIRYGYTSDGANMLGKLRFPHRALVLSVSAGLLLSLAAFLWYKKTRKAELDRKRLLEEENKALREENASIGYLNGKIGRMRAFIENIAHQIKTPVSRTVVSLEYLKDHPEEQNVRIPECLSHVNGISQLVTKLIEIGRMEAGAVVFRAEELDLCTLLQDAVHAAGGEDRCVIRTKRDRADSDNTPAFWWNGDYDWTQEAVSNLLVNCLEHDLSGQPVELALRDDQEYMHITIRDHGPGFSETDLPNLFDRFYQPEEAKKGHAGIGLNLSKLILEAQHGTLRAGNAEDGGAVFEIMLPRFSVLNRKIAAAENIS